MPVYDYKCEMCGDVEEFIVPSDERDNPQHCKYCEQRVMRRQFPVEAIKGLQVWEPHYNEAFDCDVNTRREWQSILKDKNVIEAGDSVRGGRDFDPKANNLMPQPVKGKQYVPEDVRRLERIKARQNDNVEVETSQGWKKI